MNAIQDNQNMTVLIADANRSNRMMLRRLLERKGYLCLTVETGGQVFDAMRETHVRLLLTEMKFPDMDGLKLVRHIRSNPSGPNPQIIAVTGCTTLADRQHCFEVGCDEYEPKPLVIERLLDKMNKLFDPKTVQYQVA